MKKASGTYYSIINPRSFLFTLIIIFILVFGAASIIAYKHYRSALLYAIAENKSTASFLSTLIYEHQNATIGILESYARRPLFIDAIQKRDFHHVLYHLKSLNEHHTEIDALFLTDQYGTLWANYPVAREGFEKNLAYRDWYKGVSKNWRPYISSVYRLIVLEKGLAVAVSVPVFDKKGKVIGILSSADRTFFLATFIRANTLNPRKNIILLDQEGNIIYGNTVDYEKEITKYLRFSPIQEAIRNGKNILEIPDPVRGKKEDLLAFSPIRDIGWTVIVSEGKGAILRSETTYFIEIYTMAFLLFVCMTIAPLLLRRDYQYRETKELLTQEKKLRESEARYKELFENMYVGIAVYEAIQDGNDFIFKDFNEGGEKIDNVKRGDIIGKKVTEAFPGVAEFGLLDVFGRVWKTGNSEHHPVGIYKDQRISGWRENYVYKLPSGEIVAVYDDVTAQKQAEDALRHAEENFRRSLDDSPLGVRIVTTEGETIYANRAILEIYGYDSIEELRTTPVKKRYTPESYAEFQIRKKKRQQGEYDPPEYEISIVRKNGEVRHLQVFRKEVLWSDEKQYQAIYLDITERKRAEEALRRKSEEQDLLLNNIQTQIWYLTDGETYGALNKARASFFGKKNEEMENKKLYDVLGKDEAEICISGNVEVFKKRKQVHTEEWLKNAKGERRLLSIIKSPKLDADGNVEYVVCTAEDITERKRIEVALRESEENFKALAENANDGIVIGTGEEVRHVYANRRAVEITGYPIEELLKTRIRDLALPDELPKLTERYKKRLAGLEVPKPYETVLVNKDGIKVPIEISPSKTTWQNQPADMVILRDITERKWTEEALKKSAQLLRDTGEMAKVGGWELDLSTKEVSWTEEVGRIHGVEPGYKPKLEEVLNFYAPESRPVLEVVIKKAAETGEPYDLESLFIPSGSKDKIWVRSLGRAVYSGGKIVKLTGTFQNIDKYKRAEEALRESEERYRNLVESISDVIYAINSSGVLTYISPVVKNTLGYEPDELIGRQFLEFVHKEDQDLLMRRFSELGDGIVRHSDYRLIGKHGDIKWVRTLTNPIIEEGGFAGAHGVLIDITERKQAEEALQATKELFEKTFISQRDAIFLLDAIIPPTILDCNPAATEVFGYTHQEMVGRTMDFLHLDETALKEFQRHLHSTLFERGFFHQFKFRMKRKNGAIFHTEHSVTQLKDEQGKGIGWVSVVRDITERIQAEEKLAEREMFNFALFEYNPIETIVVNLEGKVVGWNLAKKKAGDRLPDIGDVMYKDYAGMHEIDMYAELMECIRSGESREFPEQKYGGKVLFITISPFPKGAVIISQDITERKWAEERILTYQEQLRSLASELSLIEERERRHIATELHDNISQTLAIIKIKLGMAQEVTSSTDWVGFLNEIGELIDQAIQYTRSLTFELSPPILYELGFEAAAEWLTEKIQEQHHIEIGFEDDRRSKPMSEEIRIALFKATKELLINIVKHAQAPKAKVSIWREDRSIRIRVEDDGVGFSTSESKQLRKAAGFGLFNIRERMKYLGGDMVIESEPGRGTRVTLSAPLEED